MNDQIWRPLLKNEHDLKRAEQCVLCRPGKRNTRTRTRGNCVRELSYELLYNNGNKELPLQELHSAIVSVIVQ